MHCKKCHHTDEAHKPSERSSSLLKLGACQIPDCSCNQYVDEISQIDEELM